MVQLGSLLRVSDKTCAVIAQCIKVFGSSKIAYLGDLVLVSLL